MKTERISYKRIRGAELPDSSVVDIAVINVAGKKSGPTLFIDSTLHGPEPGGIRVIHELVHRVIDPERLRGKIIAVPIANPLAFCLGTRNTPHDGVNLNRAFPGKMDGTVTEQMAHAIFEEARKSDCVIDIHGNYEPGLPYTIVKEGSGEAFSKSKKLARAYGVTMKINPARGLSPEREGTLSNVCVRNGIHAFGVEMACYGRVVENEVELAIRGVTNVMKHLNMLQGKIEDQSKYTIVLDGEYQSERVMSKKAGIIKYHVTPGDKLQKNDVIAELRNVYGEKIEDILATKEAYFLAPRYACSGNKFDAFNQAISAGDSVGTIFVRR